MSELSVKERLKSPIPKFFKKVIRISMSLASAAVSILVVHNMGYIELPEEMIKACNIIIGLGVGAAASSTTTVDYEKLKQLKK